MTKKQKQERRREFNRICGIEPKLKALYKEAKSVKDDGVEASFCANAVWYGYGKWRGIRSRVIELVGWECKTRELKTTSAYDVAYDEIYEVLPNCRNCMCG
jgi:hypothetical protein